MPKLRPRFARPDASRAAKIELNPKKTNSRPSTGQIRFNRTLPPKNVRFRATNGFNPKTQLPQFPELRRIASTSLMRLDRRSDHLRNRRKALAGPRKGASEHSVNDRIRIFLQFQAPNPDPDALPRLRKKSRQQCAGRVFQQTTSIKIHRR